LELAVPFSLEEHVSLQTAHELAYGIGATAIVLSILILTLHFLKGRKNIFPDTNFMQYGASNESTLNSVVMQETNETN
jgi:hypothetical protein